MKNIYKFLVVALFCNILLVSCDGFLEEENRGSLTPGVYYDSDGQAINAVNGIYRQLFNDQAFYGTIRGSVSFIRAGADDTGTNRTARVIPNNLVIPGYEITETNNEDIERVWSSIYNTVNAANNVIDGISNNRANLTDEVADRGIGEAIFLRALMYYHATNLFGDVPFFDGSVSVTANSEAGRTDKTIVREAQVAALTRIETEGLLSQDRYSGRNLGRPTLWAAKMLKAKILMWLGDYQAALKECQDIMSSGRYSLLPNFADIFNTGQSQPSSNIYHDEMIFGYDFNSSVATGDVVGDKTWRVFTPNSAEENRYTGMTLPAGVGFNNGTSNLVAHPDFVANFPAGPRKDATYSDGTDVTTNNAPFPSGSTYLEKMWSTVESEKFGGRNGDFLVIFRYADVLLMAAEAAAESGDNATARGYLDQVQIRGNGVASPTSANGLIQDIRDERGWELTAEGFRRYDLIRWGVLVETVRTLSIIPARPGFTNSADPASNIRDHHIYLPIPPQELLLNPNLLLSDPTNNGYR